MKVRCILCGDDSALALSLADGDTFACSACNDEFTSDQVREHLDAWARMLKWVRLCPAREDNQEVAR